MAVLVGGLGVEQALAVPRHQVQGEDEIPLLRPEETVGIVRLEIPLDEVRGEGPFILRLPRRQVPDGPDLLQGHLLAPGPGQEPLALLQGLAAVGADKAVGQLVVLLAAVSAEGTIL